VGNSYPAGMAGVEGSTLPFFFYGCYIFQHLDITYYFNNSAWL
jgi:hypothetical protein